MEPGRFRPPHLPEPRDQQAHCQPLNHYKSKRLTTMKTSGVARSIGHRFEKERYTLSVLSRTHLIHTWVRLWYGCPCCVVRAPHH
jgi:hypothetical protein